MIKRLYTNTGRSSRLFPMNKENQLLVSIRDTYFNPINPFLEVKNNYLNTLVRLSEGQTFFDFPNVTDYMAMVVTIKAYTTFVFFNVHSRMQVQKGYADRAISAQYFRDFKGMIISDKWYTQKKFFGTTKFEENGIPKEIAKKFNKWAGPALDDRGNIVYAYSVLKEVV